MHKKFIQSAMIIFSGIIFAFFLPRALPYRLILQLALVAVGLLIAYYFMSSRNRAWSLFSGPTGLPIGFLVAAIGSTIIHGTLSFLIKPSFSGAYLTMALVLCALLVSIAASTFEEIFFRGPLLAILRYKPWPLPFIAAMVVIQAILFTALHYNKYRFPSFYLGAFALGLLLGVVVIQRRSLWLAMGLHAGLDFISALANGIHFGHALDLPGMLSFDAPGNATKIATAAVFPLAGLIWMALDYIHHQRDLSDSAPDGVPLPLRADGRRPH
jgi:membrane protease YdiL (CAAX protease family)